MSESGIWISRPEIIAIAKGSNVLINTDKSRHDNGPHPVSTSFDQSQEGFKRLPKLAIFREIENCDLCDVPAFVWRGEGAAAEKTDTSVCYDIVDNAPRCCFLRGSTAQKFL